ncbi:hypothetical protein Rhopal_001287-T1 [Rhodotorula paludigena]|uniref:TEA domain-containing protein n=1 Tax=Rhodotorula paludigena TaxID=86838 RepID=A0AAV5GG36_9BASI|nr:hypothetical protein Rhopal_001287-T1 [Rhodotorula paludigena]
MPNAEYLVVLEVEVGFGRLKLPRFSNSVRLPTPLCLRNTLSFTLPSPEPPTSSANWDLSVRPSLSNVASTPIACSSSSSTSATQINGSLPSSPSIVLRWTPQLLPTESHPLVIPHVSIETAWRVHVGGQSEADVRVVGEFEHAGLRDKQWIDLEICAAVTNETAFEVLSCEGGDDTPVLRWEIAHVERDVAAPPPLSHRTTASSDLTLSAASIVSLPSLPIDNSRQSPTSSKTSDSGSILSTSTSSATSVSRRYPSTPTPSATRRRVSRASRSSEARPPSFTSLFDTAPPAPPVLDTSFIAETGQSPGRDGSAGARGKSVKETSLMKVPAPFDPEASAMDMSFEVSHLEEQRDLQQEDAPPTKPSSAQCVTMRVRVQLDLSDALQSFATSASVATGRPSFSFRLCLAFPASSLSSSTNTGTTRLSLPAFSLAAALAEESLVSVIAVAPPGQQAQVELLNALAELQPGENAGKGSVPPSPLPAHGGRARWAASRRSGDPAPAVAEIDIKLDSIVNDESDSEVGVLADEEDDTRMLMFESAPTLSRVSTARGTAQPADPTPPHFPPPSPHLATLAAVPTPPSENYRTTSLSHLRIEITPIPPTTSSSASTQSWRVHYRYVFSHAYTGALVWAAALARPGETPSPARAWDADGREILDIGDEVESASELGFTRLLSPDEKLGGALALGAELVGLEAEVAKVQVGLAIPQGFKLDVRNHDFDLRGGDDSSTLFFAYNAPARRPLALDAHFARPAEQVPWIQQSRRNWWIAVLLIWGTPLLIIIAILGGAAYDSRLSRLSPPAHREPILHDLTAVHGSSTGPNGQLATSLLRTPLTVTTTATRTVSHISTSTVVVTSTSTLTSTRTSTSTITERHHHATTYFAPAIVPSQDSSFTASPAASPHSTPSDTLVSASPDSDPLDCRPEASPPASASAVAVESARDLLRALQVWVERVKLSVKPEPVDESLAASAPPSAPEPTALEQLVEAASATLTAENASDERAVPQTEDESLPIGPAPSNEPTPPPRPPQADEHIPAVPDFPPFPEILGSHAATQPKPESLEHPPETSAELAAHRPDSTASAPAALVVDHPVSSSGVHDAYEYEHTEQQVGDRWNYEETASAASGSVCAADGLDESDSGEEKTRKGGKKRVWFTKVHEAFVRAIQLLPNLGKTRYSVRGVSMQRNDMICEYIRRQTGHLRSATQVTNYLSQLRRDRNTDQNLQGHVVSQKELVGTNWDELLGPDRFPHVKLLRPPLLRPQSSAQKQSAPKREAESPIFDPLAAHGPKRIKVEQHSSPAYPPYPILAQYPQPYPQHYVSASPLPPSLAPPAFQPHSPYSPSPLAVPAGLPALPPRSLPASNLRRPRSPSFHLPLLAFLASSSPGRDFASTASTLVAAGIDSLDSLVNLLLIGEHALDGFLELLQKRHRVEGMQLAWLRRGLEAARTVVRMIET